MKIDTSYLDGHIRMEYDLFTLFKTIDNISISGMTMKEAQSALTPVSMLAIVPMLLSTFGVVLDYKLSFVPMINHTMLLSDVIFTNMGFNEYMYILITIVSTFIYVWILIRIISKQYKSEKILFTN